MAATLPVPIEFALPDGWRSVSPDEAETPEVAFVALKPAAALGGFTPAITISGELREAADLAAIGDEVVENLRTAGAREVRLGRRSEVGTPASPGMTQAVRLTVPLHGEPAELVQFQAFLLIRDQLNPRREAVLHVVLSALAEKQFERVIEDFAQFLATIEPEKAPR